MSGCQRDQTSSCLPVRLGADGLAALAACNLRWRERLARFREYGGAPWWGPGLVVTPELRGRYEIWLPVHEFCADLARLGERLLPDPSWVPRLLRGCRSGPCGWPAADAPAALPDLWARLPERFAARVEWTPDDLPALYCALADPPHFGTDAERYPAQQELLRDSLASHRGRSTVRLLDLACGVGLGTYEMAALAAACGLAVGWACGLTVEPIEAWMATAHRLPHDPCREARLRRLAAAAPPVHFAAADVRRVPLAGPADVIVCNGLVGGPHVHRDDDLRAVLGECRRLLAPDGVALLANRFHDGRRPHAERCAKLASAAGWRVTGEWRSLCLRRSD